MIKFLRLLFCITCSFIFLTTTKADILTDCMRRISDNADFQKAMTEEIFLNPATLTQEGATQNKPKILGLIASNVLSNCMSDLAALTKVANGKVWYPRDGKTYAFQFKMEELFQYINIPTGIMLYNKPTLSVGEVIQLSDINKLYWSDECSDHTIWDNLDNDAAVNIAGQKVFSQYGGADNEYFLDFEDNDRRAFPGLVLMDETATTTEKIVSFNNLHTAIAATQSFAGALKNTACGNDGLTAYVVALNVQPGSTDSVISDIAASTSIATGVAGAAIGSAAAIGWIPVAGWAFAVGAVAVGAIAGGISLIPGEISDIQRVMVMDGPYLIQ